MNTSQVTQDEQKLLWNGSAGQSWIEAQATLDEMFQRFEELLVEAVASRPAAHVLDVGCGTGSTTLAMARRLGPQGRSVGVDISAPMIERARLHAQGRSQQGGTQQGRAPAEAAVSFTEGDAELQPFEPASFDLIVSRFGVMFFNDPVRAFSNLRRAARDGAELYCFAWRGPEENPFMTAAERAAAPLLPNLPPRNLEGPGQFAFAEPSRVRRILEQSGWADIELQPIDVECTFPHADLVRYATRLGPLGRVLREVDEQTKERLLATVLGAFAPFVHGDRVRFVAACWSIRARARGAGSNE